MVSAFAQQVGVYGGRSIGQGSTVPDLRRHRAEGSSAGVGTISGWGLYVAPAALAQPDIVTIKAVSVAEPAKSGAAQGAITQPQVQ
jgi:hypothetical protein